MGDTITSDFPKFRDGDVVLIVSTTKIYQLHSSVLRRNSPFFATQLDAEPGAKLTAQAICDGCVPYWFELVKETAKDIGVFVRQDLKDISGHHVSYTYVVPELDNSKIANEQHRHWDMLLGSFYNRQPEFDDHDLATVLSDCMGLIDVAESIGSIDHVREIVDLSLLRQDKTLWTSIARNPTAWADLGRRVHSPMIFTESVIHLIGKWKTMAEEEKAHLEAKTRDLCEQKVQELEVAKEAIEMRILGHYPYFLTRNASSKPGRPTYANDIYMWMALSFFRQWFAQAISDGRNRVNADGGYLFYNQLAKGGSAYLDHETFRNFHMYFPMSSKACNVLEANMGVLKEDIKAFVGDLVQERTHLKKSEDNSLTWLTCAIITKEHYPWATYEPTELGETPVFVSGSFDDDDDNGDDDDDDDGGENFSPPIPPMQIRKNGRGKAKKASSNADDADDEE